MRGNLWQSRALYNCFSHIKKCDLEQTSVVATSHNTQMHVGISNIICFATEGTITSNIDNSYNILLVTVTYSLHLVKSEKVI
jgi:hypothetical protein